MNFDAAALLACSVFCLVVSLWPRYYKKADDNERGLRATVSAFCVLFIFMIAFNVVKN